MFFLSTRNRFLETRLKCLRLTYTTNPTIDIAYIFYEFCSTYSKRNQFVIIRTFFKRNNSFLKNIPQEKFCICLKKKFTKVVEIRQSGDHYKNGLSVYSRRVSIVVIFIVRIDSILYTREIASLVYKQYMYIYIICVYI